MLPHIDTARLMTSGCEDPVHDRVCRSRGGESCAFDGAMIVLQPIADAAHVVHGPLSCCANTWASRGVRSHAGDLHRRGFCSDLRELDIVYGGEGRLLATVLDVVERVTPAAVFVYATCVSGISGEDIGAACRQAEAVTGVPCIPVDAPGFVGPKNLGNRIAGEVLIDRVVGSAEPPATGPFDVVLIGEYNVAGDLDHVEPLLGEAGIRVLTRMTGNARFEELRWAHRSRLALLVCGRALVNVARHLRDRWGVPYLEGSFFGPTEIARTLRGLAAGLEAGSAEAEGVSARVEEVISRREHALAGALAAITNLHGRKAVLYSGGVKSWAMIPALRDLGIEVAAVGVKKASHEDERKVRALLGPDAVVMEDVSPDRLRDLMARTGATILVAGGRNRFLAAKEGWPFVDVNQERHTAYAGYEGFADFARDLSRSVEYHERERAETVPSLEVLPSRREGGASIDPLRSSASLGAVMALQGIDGALPVLHGAQGCTFLEKVALVKHFAEPVALVSTALFTEEVVLGSADRLAATLDKAVAIQRPRLIGVVTTALMEITGDDVGSVVDRLGEPTVLITPSDHDGGLEQGWAASVASLLELAERGPVDPMLVTVLAGSHLTPGDVAEMRETIEAFGLMPVMVPDISSMDGGRDGFGPLAQGTPLARIRALGGSSHTLVAGRSLEPAARRLHERFGTPFTCFDGLTAMRDNDTFLGTLSLLSGNAAPPAQARRRRALLDAMRDAHLVLGAGRVAIALEPDHALQVSRLLWESGCDPVAAIVPSDTSSARRTLASRVEVGDMTSIPPADVVISNTHAEDTARRLGARLVTLGFPAHGCSGATRRVTIGYRGAAGLLAELADALHAPHAVSDREAATRDQGGRS